MWVGSADMRERAILWWLCLLVPSLLSGCLAQKADVRRVEDIFARRVADLDNREKDLERKIAEAARNITAQQKQAEQLFREARARSRQDIIELQEHELPRLRGQLEHFEHYSKGNRERLDNLKHRMETLTEVVLKHQAEIQTRLAATEAAREEQEKKLTKTERNLRGDLKKTLEHVQALSPALQSLADKVDSRLAEQNQAIAANREHTAVLAKQSESQLRVLTYQITTFRKALPEFIKAVDDLGKELVKGDTELAQEVSKQTQALSAKIDLDILALSAHLTEVTQKIDSDIHLVTTHLGDVTRKVDTDGTATAEHLAEVNKSVASVAEALKAMSGEVMTRVDAQDRRGEETGAHLAEVSQSVTLVAEALKTMGADVAARADALESRLDETTNRITEVSEGVTSMEETLKTMSAEAVARADAQESRLEETANRMTEVSESVTSVAEALKTMSVTIMGRVDVQERRLDEATDSLREVTAEVNTLIQAVTRLNETSGLESKGAPSSQAVASASPSPVGPAAELSNGLDASARQRYEGILATLKEGDLDAAQQGFRDFLRQYPTSSRAPNAQYWLGECYYGKKQYQRAIAAYDEVEANYPNSGKVPAALLKKGYAYLALEDHPRGLGLLERVVRAYPGSPEAAKASNRLSRLKGVR